MTRVFISFISFITLKIYSVMHRRSNTSGYTEVQTFEYTEHRGSGLLKVYPLRLYPTTLVVSQVLSHPPPFVSEMRPFLGFLIHVCLYVGLGYASISTAFVDELEHLLVDTGGYNDGGFKAGVTPCSLYNQGSQNLGRQSAAQWIRFVCHTENRLVL